MIDFNQLLEEEKKIKGYGPNSEQLSVIFSDKNTIVSAGAGSGKTTVLSYRFLRLVLEGKAKVDEILTLTFTRKAAAEMHTRILKQLLKYKDEPIVRDQLELFSSASISTLDSFCSQIVRADCLRYGIARDFSITSETLEGEESALQIANEMLEEEQYKAPLSILAKKLSLPDLYSSFFLPLSKMCSIITKLDVDETAQRLRDELLKAQKEKYDKVLEINSYLENEYVDSLSDKAQTYFLENKTVFLNKDLDSSLHGLNKIVVRNKPFGEDYKEQFNEQKALWTDYKNISFALEHIAEEEVLLLLVNDYILRLQKNKREKGELSFTDVAELAVEILKTNKVLRKYFKDKFKYIMIDEFQDNNALQKELLYLLGEADDKENDGEITSADLNKNKLFFVGDEKQSIYRFRGADVSVFKALSEEIRCTDGNVLTLSANYRSEPLIIEHVNAVFRKLFKGEKAYEASSQDALTKYDIEGKTAPEVSAENASVNLFIHIKDEDKAKNEDEKELLLDNESEAFFVADKIEEIVKSGKYKVRNGKAPTWSDIAILLRTGSNQMCFEKALLAKGIPYSVEESRSLMLEAIASDIYSALQYLLYPEDRSAYIALLRSPFVRMKDSAIYTLINKGEAELSSSEEEKLSCFKAHIEKATELLQNGSLTALIDYLYYNTGYYAYILSNPKYHAYLENYDTLWALARDYEAEGYSATAFLSYLRDNMASANKLNSTPGWKEGQDAVKILTIHKSKGLEYPVVFISNAGAGIAPRRAGFAFKTDFGICTNLPDVPFSALFGDEDGEKDRAEMLRLLYVATTRAMGHLFISGKLKLKKDGSLGKTAISTLLGQYLIGIGAYDEEGKELGTSIIPIGYYSALTKEDIEKAETKGDKEALAQFVTNVSDKAFKPTTQKVNASALEVEDIDTSNSTVLPPLKCDEILIKNNLITEFGTFCHLLCEYAVKGLNWEAQSFNKGDLKESECINECGKALVKNLMGNEYFNKLLSLGKSECEVRFFMPFEDSLLEGVADLIIISEDYCLVLDYKTDKEIVKDNHKAQVLAYLKAVSELYGGKKTYGSLIYLRDIKKEVIWDMNGNEVELL